MISRRNAIVGAGAVLGVGSATCASALLASDVKYRELPPDAVRLTRAVLDIHATYDVPNDVFIAPDFKTDNLIVIKGEIGFAVTRTAIEHGQHLEMFGPCLKGLIEADNALKADPSLRPLFGLLNDRTKTV